MSFWCLQIYQKTNEFFSEISALASKMVQIKMNKHQLSYYFITLLVVWYDKVPLFFQENIETLRISYVSLDLINAFTLINVYQNSLNKLPVIISVVLSLVSALIMSIKVYSRVNEWLKKWGSLQIIAFILLITVGILHMPSNNAKSLLDSLYLL